MNNQMPANQGAPLAGTNVVSNANRLSVGVGPQMNRIRAFPTGQDEEYINSLWNNLRRSIYEIQHKNNSGLSFEELYRSAYTMVLHKHAEKLYNGMKELFSNYLREEVSEVVMKSINSGFLKTLNRTWHEHTTSLVMIRDILMYMDRVYVSQRGDIPSIYDLGLQLFRDEIISSTPVNEVLKSILLNMVASERNRETIEWMDLRNACQMLITLGLGSRNYYESEFEDLFLEETADYYRRAAQNFLAENSANIYINKVNECFRDEHDRAERYLDASTETHVMKVLNRELITKNLQPIVEMANSGLIYMLNNQKIEEMRQMYELFCRVPEGIEIMIRHMSTYLRKRGEDLIKECMGNGNAQSANKDSGNTVPDISLATDDSEQHKPTTSSAITQNATSDKAISVISSTALSNPHHFIQSLIDLKDQFDQYLRLGFLGNREFEQRIQLDFSHFINLSSKSAEYLSLYIDEKLRKGLKVSNENDIEVALDKAMVLFKFLQDKDLFEGFYRQHLAKRLLLGKNGSDELEKTMISKLKTECGTHFTTKLECMFRDIELANNVMNEYKDIFDANRPDVEISVRVLSQNSWPISNLPQPCILPREIDQAFQHFQKFYLGKHSGRRITLNAQLGSADLRATFYGGSTSISDELSSQPESDQPGTSGGINNAKNDGPKRRGETKILQITTYQMIILLRFNYQDRISFEKLLSETQIPDKDLKRALQSLAMGKSSQRILCRHGSGREIENSDVFSVNDNFTSKLTRIKVLPVSTGRNISEHDQQEQDETRAKVDDDRKHEIEAAIVRVLKARKKIGHNDLVSEVTNQLKHRFMPDPTLIKKRIESLIEREYLERDVNNHRQYSYIA